MGRGSWTEGPVERRGLATWNEGLVEWWETCGQEEGIARGTLNGRGMAAEGVDRHTQGHRGILGVHPGDRIGLVGGPEACGR